MNSYESDSSNISSSSGKASVEDTDNRETSAGPDNNGAASAGREAAGKAKRAGRGALSQAREEVARVAGEQKDNAADRIGSYSSAFRESVKSIEQEDPNVAYFANQAADQIESVASYIRDSDFNRLRRDAEGLARRHPALFMGGMLVAGLVLGNLAKASGQALREAGQENEENGGSEAGLGGADYARGQYAGAPTDSSD